MLWCAGEALTGNKPSQHCKKLAIAVKHICAHICMCRNGAPQSTGALCCSSCPSQEPFGCPLLVQTAQESREALAPARAAVYELCCDRPTTAGQHLPCPNASSRAHHREHCGKGSDTSARGKVCSPSLLLLVQPPQSQSPPEPPKHNEGEALGLEGGVSPSAAGRGYAPAGPALR